MNIETIRYYDTNADAYAQRYADADLALDRLWFSAQIIHRALPVLDLGCGPGRDLAAFARRGKDVVGVDLSAGFLKLARSAAPVAQADIRALPFATDSFGGVWACASLVHTPADELPQVLSEVARVLVRGGVFFASLKAGEGSEWVTGEGGRRWFQYYTPDVMVSALDDVGFRMITAHVEETPRGNWLRVYGRG